jgi:hypothetical protein
MSANNAGQNSAAFATTRIPLANLDCGRPPMSKNIGRKIHQTSYIEHGGIKTFYFTERKRVSLLPNSQQTGVIHRSRKEKNPNQTHK